MCTNWEVGYGNGNWKLWKDVALLMFGVVGCVAGTYCSIRDIMNGGGGH